METSSFTRMIRKKILFALDNRILQVIQKLKKIDPAFFEKDAIRVSIIIRQFFKADLLTVKEYFPNNKISNITSSNYKEDCLIILEKMAQCKEISEPSINNWNEIKVDKSLEKLRRQDTRRFSYLTERYRHPLNILLAEENALCELVLFQLMVPDRTKLDSGKSYDLNLDEIFLKLNLISLKSADSSDLRFLDVLNYYFERISLEEKGKGKYPWLKISFLSLYLRALVYRAGGLGCA